MVLFMKDYGKIIYTMGEENYIMLVGIFMKVNLLMIWHKDSVFTDMLMGANMLDIGTKTSSMDLEKKSGMMEVNIKDFTKMLQKKVRESIAGQMEIDI